MTLCQAPKLLMTDMLAQREALLANILWYLVNNNNPEPFIERSQSTIQALIDSPPNSVPGKGNYHYIPQTVYTGVKWMAKVE